MKNLKHLVIAGLMLVVAFACEKDSLTTVDEIPRYFQFEDLDGNYLVQISSTGIRLFKWNTFSLCWRDVREGDWINAVPPNPNIAEYDDRLEILDLNKTADRVAASEVIKCD